jgi:glycosyltransferase involved in cell wall biosynthesis
MDSQALAAAANGFLDAFDRAEAMGREARRVFDARYDSGIMVGQYLDLYRGCLGEGPAPTP